MKQVTKVVTKNQMVITMSKMKVLPIKKVQIMVIKHITKKVYVHQVFTMFIAKTNTKKILTFTTRIIMVVIMRNMVHTMLITMTKLVVMQKVKNMILLMIMVIMDKEDISTRVTLILLKKDIRELRVRIHTGKSMPIMPRKVVFIMVISMHIIIMDIDDSIFVYYKIHFFCTFV